MGKLMTVFPLSSGESSGGSWLHFSVDCRPAFPCIIQSRCEETERHSVSFQKSWVWMSTFSFVCALWSPLGLAPTDVFVQVPLVTSPQPSLRPHSHSLGEPLPPPRLVVQESYPELTQRPLHSPLLSQFPSKTQSCQCPFPRIGCFRPGLASCFAFVKPTDQPQPASPHPSNHGIAPDLTGQKQPGLPCCPPALTQDIQDSEGEGGGWRVVPLNQHHS